MSDGFDLAKGDTNRAPFCFENAVCSQERMAGECTMRFSVYSCLITVCRDGHYGLWLDGSLEKGVSSTCPTFGNEPLSEEGTKFDVIGVEVWYIGA